MNPYWTAVPAAGAVLLDISFAPSATVLDARASLTVVTVCLWAALRPRDETLVIVPLAGLLLGLLGNEPLGVSVLALAPIVLLADLLEGGRSTERRFIRALTLVIFGSVLYGLGYVVAARVFGGVAPVGIGALRILLAGTLLNAALATVLYFPLSRLGGLDDARGELRRF
jgi:rod shape-determining protein MreD